MADFKGWAHVGFTVMNMERTLDFWVNDLGGKLISQADVNGEMLGKGVMGGDRTYGSLRTAMVEIGGKYVEFFQYLTPATSVEFHGDPSIAGSAHLALEVDDICEMYDELLKKGVRFNSEVNENVENGKVTMKWVYLRDAENICIELIENCK